jgi:hypothetical protein
MPLLLDIADLSEAQSDAALEFMCKAHGDDSLSDAIYDEHPSPFIRRLVELFYERGLLRLSDCRDELSGWLVGAMHQAGPLPTRPDGAMVRWTPAEMQLVRIYLTALPPAQFVLDDYLLLTDFLFQRYLPADDLRTEAQWLSTRSNLMGRIQANMATVSAAQADILLSALPISVAAAKQTFDMTRIQSAVMDYASAHAVENVTAFSDAARHRVRRVIMEVEAERLTDRPGTIASALQTRLFDEFADMNRDWRRIAVTEAGEALNQGVTASMPVGAKLKRVEQYRDACPFCKRIDGVVMTVADPADPAKDGTRQVWPGKTNVGRAAAPRKRVGNELIAREPEERWWIPAGVVHPHCRGRWVPTAKDPSADRNFNLWLDTTLGESRVG